MKRFIKVILSDLLLFTILFIPLSAANINAEEKVSKNTIKFTIKANSLNRVDNRIFGQFLEKNGWEPGPEKILKPGTKEILPEVIKLLKDMKVPVIRFPGGTDVDYIDWKDMIDNIPGRDGTRPDSSFSLWGRKKTITNAFGYDEFLKMTENLKSDPILVVNFRTGLTGIEPLEKAASEAAGLVAYCNGKEGDGLPEGMPDWPAIREKNGHAAPYKVKYFEIGNEIWSYLQDIKKLGYETKENMAEWFIKCLNAYVDAMRSVDPEIKILIDGKLDDITGLVLNNQAVQKKVDYLTYHYYEPLGITKVYKGADEYPIDRLKADEAWSAMVAFPAFDLNGRASIPQELLPPIKADGSRWKAAFTEWNWNGDNQSGKKMELADSMLARGIGAAGWLNAFIREGNNIEIATQSALICARWEIGTVRVDINGKTAPYYTPTGLVSRLYGKYHGDKRLDMTEENVPVIVRPFTINKTSAYQKVAVIDAVATEGKAALYFHAINRDFSKPCTIEIDIKNIKGLGKSAILHTLTGNYDNKPVSSISSQVADIRDSNISQIKDGKLIVTLPERSVSVIEIPKAVTASVKPVPAKK